MSHEVKQLIAWLFIGSLVLAWSYSVVTILKHFKDNDRK